MNNDKVKAYILDFLNDTINYSEYIENRRLFTGKANPEISLPKSYSCNEYMEKLNFYPDNAHCIELVLEHNNKSINMILVDNIQYEPKNSFVDGDPLIIRFFTLQSDNGMRFFSALGAEDKFVALGPPTEHAKEEFMHLLGHQPQLQNNHFIQYLKATITYNDLDSELHTHNTANNTRPKI